MSTSNAPVRLASEDIIINAPMSYAGSAQRIIRIRRRAQGSTASSRASAMMAPVYAPGELIADADRDQTIEELRGHMLAGRLSTEDFETRVGSVHRAHTRAQLDLVRRDLPTAAS